MSTGRTPAARGMLRPGEAVRFVRVTLDEAERAYREAQADLRRWLARLGALVGHGSPAS